jgi:hypothetical protein
MPVASSGTRDGGFATVGLLRPGFERGVAVTFEESFCVCEEEALGFLVADHGFRRAARAVDRGSEPGAVSAQAVYRASEIDPESAREVVLRIAPLRLELGLQIASAAAGSYSIEELHALDGREPFPQRMHGLYDAMLEPEQLLAEFDRLGRVLRACGRRFFNDEPALWDDLQERRERRVESDRIRNVLADAKAAFYARDWLQVVALLAPIEPRLGRRASARLAYARRKALDEA